MGHRTRQIEALLAAAFGALMALVSRYALHGVYMQHRDEYAVLKSLDVAVLAAGAVAAAAAYWVLRRQADG
ncbi:hypothetical protein AB0C76_38460 [Kitasatospora sp. NPDC048722]|uniref:hypothetical protein n=1 Tax=Kitasatospora sp. NPDC048722 TaxID=3155639 RepID=UPI0033E47A8E